MAKETSDLRNLTKEELELKLSAIKADLYGLRYQAKASRMEKSHKVNQMKKTIARINTILNEKGARDGTGAA